MRKDINAMVRNYAKANGGCYEETWNRLYKEFNFFAHTYIKAKARKNKCSVIEMVERLGKLGTLFAIARLMFN